jgi:alpha-glucosidase (family GH31 glycosyl hydrolase)/uncharacterized membrane protein
MSTRVSPARPRSMLPELQALAGVSTQRTWPVALSRMGLAVGLGVCIWAVLFGGLALARHAAGGTHAEDLGFTDQVVWNFLRGQWFRMSVYQGATWNTEIEIARLARPDSLLAFHVEPILLLFVPLYALGGDARLLLGIQALALALGAVPAYRLGARWAGASWAGVVIAAVYLLSPLGQWAVLADFHPSTLAVPLLLLAIERLAAGSARTFVVAALAAMSAREDVALAVAGLGLAAALGGRRRPGLLLLALGMGWTLVSFVGIIRTYSGGFSPFVVRYPAVLNGPAGLAEALARPEVGEYAITLLLSGGWLALLAPLALIPAVPHLALNVFSSSPWMAAGKAHYSVLVLPFVIAGAAGGLGRIARWRWRRPADSGPGPRWPAYLAAGALLSASGLAYLMAGAGPLAANYAPPTVTEHAGTVASVAGAIPRDAGVSASSSLVPHLSRRARLYVFPAVEDADYVFLDVTASPAATSPSDTYLRVHALLAEGGWSVEQARDGLLLLARTPGSEPRHADELPADFYSFVRANPNAFSAGRSVQRSGELKDGFLSGELALLSADLVPSPDGANAPDGPRGVLRTMWRADRPLPQWARPEFRFDLRDGRQTQAWDLSALSWYPLERWTPGEVVRIDVPNVPLRGLAGWAAIVSTPEDSSVPLGELALPIEAAPWPKDQSVQLGELTLQVEVDPWRLRLMDPAGGVVWEEAADENLGFRTPDGPRRRATRLVAATPLGAGAVRLLAATDDPAGRVLTIEAHSLAPRLLRLTVAPSKPAGVQSVGGAIVAGADEHFVGFGERFTGVNQRGRRVDVWAEDRVLAGYGDSTYAPLPLLLSSRGHGFTLERFERSRFDVVASRSDRWSWEQDAASASILVSYGPTLKELVERHAQATGTPPLPPIWAFGVWRTAIGGQEHVLDEARRLRELGVPVSALFAYDAVDFPANVGWPYVNFAGRWAGPYPDHVAFTAGLHRLGFKALTYFKADFHIDRPGYDEPARLGFLAKRADGQPYTHPRFPVSWLDFTNPRAVDWWRGLWRRALVDLGYDGGMLDVGELLPTDAFLADGTRGAQTHNRYPLLYAQAAWEHASLLRPDGDFVLFARSGGVGGQRFQSLQWPGDPLMRWEAPDGLRSLVPAALSFGLSGFPYWHPEVAGYAQAGLSEAEERELWLRWLQLATWTPTLRDQYGDHPTSPIDFWRDDGTIAAYRDAARMHNRLVPYLYTYAGEASRIGLPLMRFLALEAPDDPRAWQDEQSYFLGPLLLVAPVVEAGATSRTLYLPPGEWADFWTDELYRGGQEVTVPAPLDGHRAPVFVRAGAILPLAPEFDSLSRGESAQIRTYAGDLTVRITPGGTGPSEFTLYDGTRLLWNGTTALRVVANAQPRTIELRLPSGNVVTQRIEETEGEISHPQE